ncbi:MAG: ion transporter [Planctomycetota bacterium]|jgi:hypothetical protein
MPTKNETDGIARLHASLEQETVKLVLSALIIISLLPYEQVLHKGLSTLLSLLFLLIFGCEFSIRLAMYMRARKKGRAGTLEAVLLVFDLVATLSFIPIEEVLHQVKVFRVFRLTRIFLLLRYWGPIAKEVWIILMKRRYQVLFAACLVAILAFVAGVLLKNLNEDFDYDDDGVIFYPDENGNYARNGEGVFETVEPGKKGTHSRDEEDRRFSTILWWSFRQVQDPGNLIRVPQGGLVVFLSFLLTIGGLFIISFIIGIGTTVVEELVSASRSRPIGMKEHSAIMNVSRASHLLLQELQNYYMKHVRKAKIAVLGSTEARPDYLYRPELRRVRYRFGNPTNVQDLKKVDAENAMRVILLGDVEEPGSDAQVISQILSARQLNPEGWILAEIHHESNLNAAATAGGKNTIPIPVGKFAGLFLTNIVLFPGIEEVYRELLTATGQEIYTVLFGEREIPHLRPGIQAPPFTDLFNVAYERWGIILLGVLGTPPEGAEPWKAGAHPFLNPEPRKAFEEGIAGFAGLSPSFEDLRDFSLAFAEGRLSQPSATPEPRGKLPSFMLCPESFGIEKLLICNFRESLVDFIEQVALFLKKVEIFVMVRDPAEGETMETLLISHSQRMEAGGVRREGTFKRTKEGLIFRFRKRGQPPVHIRTVVGDPSDERELLDPHVGNFTLKDIDTIVYTPEVGVETDPDAMTALGLLKIWDLQDNRPEAFKPSFRIIAEVSDPDKGDLLEKRALAVSPDSRRCRQFTVLSRERIRNHFLAQAIFVPGIASIYNQLLSETGQEICRLLPVWKGIDRDAEVTFREMVHALYQRKPQLILFGVELLDEKTGVRELYLNPRSGEPGFRFNLRNLIAVCAVGDTSHFPRKGKRCLNCLRPRK